MSQISLKSISGITSITTPTGVDNQFTLHTNNTNEALKLDGAGNLHFHNHLNITGISSAANFKTGTSNLHSTGLNVQDLDVDGHTNLDNVSVAGITTFSGIVDATNTPASIRVAQDIQHKGDADTKITFPANDTISFETAGAERLRIKSDGQLIHNAENSSGHVAEFNQTHASNDARILINSPTDNNIRPAFIQLSNAGTAKWGIGQVYASTSSGAFHLLAGNNQESNSKFVVTTAGRTGIGTINPTTLLHIDDDSADPYLRIGGSGRDCGIQLSANANYTAFRADGANRLFVNAGADSIRFSIGGTSSSNEKLRITSAGLVGVGQATPTHMLHVDSSNASDSTATAFFKGRIIRFDGAASAHSPRLNFSLDGTDKAQILCHRTNFGLDIATLVAEPIKFMTNSVERVRIPDAGGIELKTDGKGIQFPTPQTPYHASSNRVGISSEMRYYETGTLTPGLSSTVLNGLQIATFTDGSYARRVNRYVRVGHIVHCFIEIKMAGSVTYNAGSTSTAPVCITGTCPFKWAYSGRYDVSGEPDFIPCSISYDSSGLTNDSVYAVLTRNYNAQPRIDITRVGSGGSRQFNSVNFGMVFPANASIAVAYSYPIDLDNADY